MPLVEAFAPCIIGTSTTLFTSGVNSTPSTFTPLSLSLTSLPNIFPWLADKGFVNSEELRLSITSVGLR